MRIFVLKSTIATFLQEHNVQITITFDPQNNDDVANIVHLGALFSRPTQPQAAAVEVRIPPETATPPDVQPAAKGKPGRKPKQEAVVPAGEPTPGTSASPTDTSEAASMSASPSSASASAQPSTNLTLDDVRAKLQAFTVAKGVPEGIALLKKFEAARISELPAEKYADFVLACKVAA